MPEQITWRREYTYDLLGRLQSLTQDGRTFRYGYDAAGNLINRGGPSEAEQRFAALENSRRELQKKLENGLLDPERFQAELNRLRLQDASGNWWQIRFDGSWLKWDGAVWVEAKPFEQ